MNIFEKIIAKEIPADIVYEDELCLAFKDITPQAPVHVLVIPRQKISSLAEISPDQRELLGHLLFKASEIAKQLNISKEGYRLVINTNRYGGQSVPHLHIHILGGRPLTWPPG